MRAGDWTSENGIEKINLINNEQTGKNKKIYK